MKKQRLFAAVLTMLMAFSVFTAAELAVSSNAIVAYAATAKVKKVTGIKVSSACDKVTIKYSKVKGASGYEIRYSTKKNGKYTKLAATKKTSYTAKAKSSKKLYYKVRAYKTVKGKKVYGAYSAVKAVTKKGHSYGSYYVQTKATCTTKGKKYQVCSKCKTKKYANISVDKIDGHSYVTEQAGCTTEGRRYCQYCGKVTSVTKALGHSFTAYVSDNNATCIADGTKTASCSRCNATDTQIDVGSRTEHNFAGAVTANGDKTHTVFCVNGCGNGVAESCSFTMTVVIPQTASAEGLRRFTCKKCAFSYDEIIPACTEHIYVDTIILATCTAQGYTLHTCSICGDSYTDNETPIAPHSKGGYINDANGYRIYNCALCGEYMETDYTCYIDLSTGAISVPGAAAYGVSTTGKTKLDLNYDGISDYELTGTATDITIDVNAAASCEVKLAGVTIVNNGAADNSFDCISIKDKTDVNDINRVVPVVSISAKNGTENNLIVNGRGKAIDSKCKLELKGQGVLNLNTRNTVASVGSTTGNGSTAISSEEKIFIKNLTLNIDSNNRGIDTETTIGVAPNTSDEYYNIEFEGNARVTIRSKNDCIRAKNMDFNLLKENDSNSVVNLFTESGDALQLEGKANNREASLIMYSGVMNLNGGNFNNKSFKAPVIDGTAQLIL